MKILRVTYEPFLGSYLYHVEYRSGRDRTYFENNVPKTVLDFVNDKNCACETTRSFGGLPIYTYEKA